MSLCINPSCPQPDHPQNLYNRYCQDCGSDLLLDGRYQVMRLLSDKSGFTRIYEVFDQRIPKILKVLKKNLSNDAEAIKLFEQEAEALKQLNCLNHPGIPQVDGYFSYQSKDGSVLHCLVMEKIEGPNLEQWLKQQGNHPISQQQALAWLKQLAEILDLVHKANWFHRDIKPSNIMLRDSGQLVLIDFGTAREETYTYLAKLGIGQNITAVVSPGYTPPEQIHGKAVPQSDFFALGRTFVYLLTSLSPSDFYDIQKDVFQWRQAANIQPKLAGLLDDLMAHKVGDRPSNAEIILNSIKEIERNLSKKNAHKFIIVLSLLILLALGAIIGYGISKIDKFPVAITAHQVKKASLENISFARTLAGSSKFCHDSCLKIIPNSSIFAGVSGDDTIKIWNLGTGELIRTLSGHSYGVLSIAISPNGQTLASGSYDKTIKIWNLRTGELIRTLSDHSGTVYSVAISPDGKTLVSGSYDKTIKIWNLETGELIRTLAGNFDWVISVAISPDGQTLVSNSWNNTGRWKTTNIKIWNLGTGELVHTFSEYSDGVSSVAISPDGKTLVSGDVFSKIKIWNLGTGELIRNLYGHSSKVYSVVISPDGKTLVSGSDDKTIKIWNLGTGELIRTLSGHSNSVNSLAISQDGKTLVSSDANGNINIWRVP